MKLGKKGTIDDVILIVGVLFIFSLLVMIGFKVYDAFNTQFQANTEVDSLDPDGYAKLASQAVTNHFPGVIDSGFLFLAIGLSVVAIALAAMVIVHPVFIMLYIIVEAILVVVSGVLSNVYQTLAANSEFTALADKMIFTSTVMNYLPFIIGIVGTILAIVMYKNYKEAQTR